METMGLQHGDVLTVVGAGLARYREEPCLDRGALVWRSAPKRSGDESVLRPAARPFAPDGGLKLLSGNPGLDLARAQTPAITRSPMKIKSGSSR